MTTEGKVPAMKHKGAVITAVVFLAAGSLICGFSFAAQGFDPRRFNTVSFTDEQMEVSGDFRDIRIHADLDAIRLIPSEDGICRVEFHEYEKMRHEVRTEDGVLDIRVTDDGVWYERIGIFTERPRITVRLPKNSYRNLTIETATGDVEFSSLSFEEDIEISPNTGETRLRDVTCRNFLSEGNTGEVELENVIAAETLTIKRNTGDVELEACDAKSLRIETNTGDVSGILLTPKRFVAETVTGKIRVPDSGEGGVCEITTGTGDIEVRVSGD